MDAAELVEWEAFYQVEPWGDERGDMQTALLACILANQWRGKGSSAKLKDFLPNFWKDERSGDNLPKMLAVGKSFAAATQAKFSHA